jgi:hypothetical protein
LKATTITFCCPKSRYLLRHFAATNMKILSLEKSAVFAAQLWICCALVAATICGFWAGKYKIFRDGIRKGQRFAAVGLSPSASYL